MTTEELDQLAKEITTTVEQLHHEYNKYFAGAEKRPPLQLRTKLEKMVAHARALQKQCQTRSVEFRARTAINKFTSYCSLWDKKLLDKEKTNKTN